MKRLVIHRHPDCARCARIARVHAALDWRGRIALSTAPPPGGALRRGQIAVVDLASGARVSGVDAFRLLCRNVPAYWPLLALLRVPAVRRRVAREFGPAPAAGCAGGRPHVHSAS